MGFDFFLWGSKHFGFYPNGRADVTEKQAQILLQDLVAENAELKETQLALDAGCGQGVVSAYLAKKCGSKITGITIVPFEIARAQKRAKKLGVSDKVKYQLMDYSATNFPDNYFDAIYTTETLSHSPDVRTTLKEFMRILKPAGRVAFFEYTIAPDDQYSEWEKKVLDLVIDGSAMLGLEDFRHGQFANVIETAGFEHVKEQNITENMRPSLYRLYRLARIPYAFIRCLGLQKVFINTTAGYEFYRMAEKGLFRYCIFTGNKPLHLE